MLAKDLNRTVQWQRFDRVTGRENADCYSQLTSARSVLGVYGSRH